MSYIEIYNERIYDLLGSGGGGGGERREALRVREHPDTGPYVEGVACHLVSSYESLQVSNMQTFFFHSYVNTTVRIVIQKSTLKLSTTSTSCKLRLIAIFFLTVDIYSMVLMPHKLPNSHG